ncbi:MAG: metal ABC transporter permease [Firmicutes bacterium]|nr:metal ABC transporter permease [Bacillota bacterium]
MIFFERIAQGFQFDFVWYALIAAVLVALCAALLGVTLVLRRFSFIGDGLSHVSFGSMAVATVVGLTVANNIVVVLPITAVAAILLLALGQNRKISGDASLAMFSVSALGLGYLLIKFSASTASTADVTCSTLFGNITTLTPTDMLLCVIMAVVVAASFVVFYNKIFSVTFDETFARATGTRASLYNLVIAVIIAVVIVIAMKLVGSLLISALIIFPAMSAMRVFKSFKSVVLCSAAVGVVCAAAGLLTAIGLEAPEGATMVAVNLAAFGVFSLLRLVLRKRTV